MINKNNVFRMRFFEFGLIFIFVYLISGCSIFDSEEKIQDGPGELPLSTLKTAPDTLIIGDKNLILRTYMWRDFQPISPPDGKPLIAIFWIITTDSTDLPEGIHADAAWIICEEEIWDTYFSEEEPPPYEEQSYQLYEVARDGPKFGPDVYVTAVVRLIDNSGVSYLLKAENQYIERTD